MRLSPSLNSYKHKPTKPSSSINNLYKSNNNSAFSIIELMVVVTIIGILALLAIPRVHLVYRDSEATATANDLRVFSEAIEFYSTAIGSYPQNMNPTNMPSNISEYIPSVWKDGNYTWNYNNDNNGTILLSIQNLDFTPEQTLRVDSIIDNGHITTGNVQIARNGGINYLFQYPELVRISGPLRGRR